MLYHYYDEKYSTSIETKVQDIVGYITDLCLEKSNDYQVSIILGSDYVWEISLNIIIKNKDVILNLEYVEDFEDFDDYVLMWLMNNNYQDRLQGSYTFPLVNSLYKELCDTEGNFKTELPEPNNDGVSEINIYRDLYHYLLMKWNKPLDESNMSLKETINYELKYKDSTAFLNDFTV